MTVDDELKHMEEFPGLKKVLKERKNRQEQEER